MPNAYKKRIKQKFNTFTCKLFYNVFIYQYKLSTVFIVIDVLISGRFVFRETPRCLAVFLLISDSLSSYKRYFTTGKRQR